MRASYDLVVCRVAQALQAQQNAGVDPPIDHEFPGSGRHEQCIAAGQGLPCCDPVASIQLLILLLATTTELVNAALIDTSMLFYGHVIFLHLAYKLPPRSSAVRA